MSSMGGASNAMLPASSPPVQAWNSRATSCLSIRALREMAFADQRELKKIAIGEQRVADHHTSPILQRVDKRANRQPAGASALTGNPTVLSLLRLEPIASRGLP